jgi:hypothetical protein
VLEPATPWCRARPSTHVIQYTWCRVAV